MSLATLGLLLSGCSLHTDNKWWNQTINFGFPTGITPEGIALRANLTVDYIKTSFDLYRRVRERSTRCLEQLKAAGYSEVRILGEGEIAESLVCDRQDQRVVIRVEALEALECHARLFSISGQRRV